MNMIWRVETRTSNLEKNMAKKKTEVNQMTKGILTSMIFLLTRMTNNNSNKTWEEKAKLRWFRSNMKIFTPL